MVTRRGCLSALREKVKAATRLITGNLDFRRNYGTVTLGAAAMVMGLATGCGAGGTGGTNGGGGGGGPVAGENTTVTLVVSSAANDQLQRFGLFLNTLTLTNKAGSSVSLLPAAQQVEFIHLNGSPEPLVTLSVPQDVYTSATATVGAASFTCMGLNNGSDTTATYAYGYTPDNQVTVQVPQTVTVEGATMALSLEMEVSQSASFPSPCISSPGAQSFEITPTFNLTAMTIATQPTNATNGRLTALEGLVASTGLGSTGFTVTAPDGANAWEISTSGQTVNSAAWTWRVSTNSSTVFQGVGNAAGLAAGMPVDMDGMLQADGSVLATRVAVLDPDTTTLTVNTGPLMLVSNAVTELYQGNRQFEGSEQYMNGWIAYNFGNTTFATWGGLTNTATLPFSATFNGNNFVAGQLVSITTHVAQPGNGQASWVPASQMTLMPQTIDGTVSGVATVGNFTQYTVSLASYDLFPQFAVQSGQTTLLNHPQEVLVFADKNTQMITGAPGVGTVARFSGLIFNDNGTLKMDCTRVAGGVTE